VSEQVQTWRQREQFLHLTRNESMKNNDGQKRGAQTFLNSRIRLKIKGAKKGDMREVSD
jgi:hypothetical protein